MFSECNGRCCNELADSDCNGGCAVVAGAEVWELGGAVVAHWAHNPGVVGSSPTPAMCREWTRAIWGASTGKSGDFGV